MAYQAAKGLTSPVGTESCWEELPIRDKSANSIFNLCRNVLYPLIPLAGWLADSKIGRYTAIIVSLWTGWLGTLLQTLGALLQYRLCGHNLSTLFFFAKYCISTTSLLLMVVSVSFCYANIFSFGLSQLLLVGESSVKVRAFINWSIWGLFLSGNSLFVGTFINYDNPYSSSVALSMSSCVVFTVCLCLQFNFSHWFEEVQVKNHYKLLYGVLKYSWKHKYPEYRSALTYWDGTTPSRIDHSKTRFGGPFSHEDVETVKTFLRILLILLSLTPFLIASDPVINGITAFVPQYENGSTELNGLANFFIFLLGDDLIIVAIPLIELVILPLFPKLEFFLINPLKGIGLAMILVLMSMSMLLMFDVIGRLLVNVAIPCYSNWTPSNSPIGLSFWVLMIPAVLSGLADMLSFLCIFEFLCSQAPSGMSGMLIGLFWFFRSICSDISAVILLLFDASPPNALPKGRLSCTSFLMFVLGFIALSGFVLYIVVARKYIKREAKRGPQVKNCCRAAL